MIDRQQLLKDLQRELPKIEKDILAYSEAQAPIHDHLQAEYDKARVAGRTAEHFVAWREAQTTQAAVAWVLTCVFVRFLEDNVLLAEPVLSGPAKNAQGDTPLQYAKERMVAYFNVNPAHAEREYLLSVFEELEKFPVIAELLDHKHNPLWQIPVSADGAKHLIDFFQKIDVENGEIVHDFTDPEWDTRFLGDLYQDLSESVRKKYALLQTPEFVESFILDYTLDKAKETFGLEGLRLIDPTCGSGHFLLTTFDRCFNDWIKREPATNARELAQRALDVVHGVDINPYAIAICRFRLFIAAMNASGSTQVKNAPNFKFNLACGDSLLHGRRFEWQGQGIQNDLIEEDPIKHVLEVEDKEKLGKILGQQYHAVVGNPPYITVKDKAVRESIRKRYFTCSGKYSLGVPFTERFFELAGQFENGRSGHVGMITANSFIKRDFGKILVEKYLPNKDVTNLIDVSGFDFAGHGTPTIIIFAKNCKPELAEIPTVIGCVSESASNNSIQYGEAWLDIVGNFNRGGFQSKYIQTQFTPREVYNVHPWSLSSEDEAGLLASLNGSNLKVSNFADSIGPATFPGLDDTFLWPIDVLKRVLGRNGVTKTFIYGEAVRSWSISSQVEALVPYDEKFEVLPLKSDETWYRTLWAFETNLKNLIGFGGKKRKDLDCAWWEWYRWIKKRLINRFSITFPFVSTHNHFVLDRGGKVFKQTAPVIKLPNGTSEADHLVLLGLLNSSVACFWGRQVFFSKRGEDVGKWGEFMEFDGTKLKRFPIPAPLEQDKDENRLLPGYGAVESYAQQIDTLAQTLASVMPEKIITQLDASTTLAKLESVLAEAAQQAQSLRNQMVALQEELDWLCYKAYGLLDEALIYNDQLPEVSAGERAFEIVLAKDLAENGGSDAWFTRHAMTQTQAMPSHWPEAYQALVQKRMELMGSERFIKLIEKPEYKRRWLPLDWQAQEQDALKKHLLSYLEECAFNAAHPQLLTCAQLAESLQSSPLAHAAAQSFSENELYDAQKLVVNLLAKDNVPQAASMRLKETALKKFRAWQETWEKQRQEDAIDKEFGIDIPLTEAEQEDPEKVAAFESAKQKSAKAKAERVGDIPVPPKYASSDFRKATYWPLRGKLDVPKERFFSLPGCEKEGDTTLVIGWAGMSLLQRAQAIAAWYIERKEDDGWEAEKLMPMLVALDELIPWLKQWHNEVDPEFGERMGDYYEGFLLEEMRLLGVSKEDLLNWVPPLIKKAKKVKTAKKAKKKTPAKKPVTQSAD